MSAQKMKMLETLLGTIIKRQVTPEAGQWMEEKAALIRDGSHATALNATFAAVPRKAGRSMAGITENEVAIITEHYPGFSVKNWPIDKLSRLWLLLQVDAADATKYQHRIDNLFRDAEMNELAALYSFLPVFAYPEAWKLRAAEGIRSNIGIVLEAIMYENPYPARYLPEQAWNQLVLKAFFTDKDVNRIIGLDERANKALASILIDYAHERQAAHRSVNPQLWRLVSKFIDNDTIRDIEKLLEGGHVTERRAAILACFNSDYPAARELLEKDPVIYAAVRSNQLNWSSL